MRLNLRLTDLLGEGEVGQDEELLTLCQLPRMVLSQVSSVSLSHIISCSYLTHTCTHQKIRLDHSLSDLLREGEVGQDEEPHTLRPLHRMVLSQVSSVCLLDSLTYHFLSCTHQTMRFNRLSDVLGEAEVGQDEEPHTLCQLLWMVLSQVSSLLDCLSRSFFMHLFTLSTSFPIHTSTFILDSESRLKARRSGRAHIQPILEFSLLMTLWFAAHSRCTRLRVHVL